MFYALRGRVTAAQSLTCLSEGVEGFLSLFEPKPQPPLQSNTTNNAEFGQALPETELGPLVGRMLAREPINAAGEFHISIDSRQHPYQGKEIMVVLQIQILEGQDLHERAYKTLFCLLGPWQADWKQEARQQVASAMFQLPDAILGSLRKQLGIWHLRVLSQAKVTASMQLKLASGQAALDFLSLPDGHHATLAQKESPSLAQLSEALYINGLPANQMGWQMEPLAVDAPLRSIDIQLKNNNSQ